MPKTSQITPNSNTARPSSTSAETHYLSMAVFYRYSVSPATVGGILSVEELLP